MKYRVVITRYHEYSVDADNENEAEKEAIRLFESDMRRPIADTFYDDIEVEEDEE